MNVPNPDQTPAGQGSGDMPAGQGYGDMPAGQGYGDIPAGQGYGDMPAGQGYADRPAGQGYGDRHWEDPKVKDWLPTLWYNICQPVEQWQLAREAGQRKLENAQKKPEEYTMRQMAKFERDAVQCEIDVDSQRGREMEDKIRMLELLPDDAKLAFHPADKRRLKEACKALGREDLAQFPIGTQIAERRVFQQ